MGKYHFKGKVYPDGPLQDPHADVERFRQALEPVEGAIHAANASRAIKYRRLLPSQISHNLNV